MFNPIDKYIIINYHYVEDPRPDFAGIVPCSVAEFERQIKFLSGNYKIVSIPEVFKAAQNKTGYKLCAITFDDGLSGQYRNALPILKKYQATATFFPITVTLAGRLPVAHKTHALLSVVAPDELVGLFNKYLVEFYPDLKEQYAIPKNRRLTNRRLHESPAIANFKETLIVLPEDIKARFLRHAFKFFGLKEKEIARKIFMTESEIKDLAREGMVIGNHSHHHYAFDSINSETMAAEINLSQPILQKIAGYAPQIFSYPHGRISQAATEVLKAHDFEYAVTIENRAVADTDASLLIPRYDTNYIRDYLNAQKS